MSIPLAANRRRSGIRATQAERARDLARIAVGGLAAVLTFTRRHLPAHAAALLPGVAASLRALLALLAVLTLLAVLALLTVLALLPTLTLLPTLRGLLSLRALLPLATGLPLQAVRSALTVALRDLIAHRLEPAHQLARLIERAALSFWRLPVGAECARRGAHPLGDVADVLADLVLDRVRVLGRRIAKCALGEVDLVLDALLAHRVGRLDGAPRRVRLGLARLATHTLGVRLELLDLTR